MHIGLIKRFFRPLLIAAFLLPFAIFAQEETVETTQAVVDVDVAITAQTTRIDEIFYSVDNLWLLVAAVLVFFMQAGFAMVEAGLNETRNVVNILFKNAMDASLGILLYFIIGYGLMYPGDESIIAGFLGFAGFGVGHGSPALSFLEATPGTLHTQVDFLFQAVFAATAATIVSGAVAGRMKFKAYLVYTVVLTGFIYPISGMWKWGGGWLDALGFHDFAGSILVHAVGGFAGLAGAMVLGPRIGRFTAEGKSVAMPGHNMAFAALGVLILWLGWFGFNPGSQLALAGTANVHAVLLIAVNTTLAAAAGGVVAMFTTWFLFKKPELSMTLNGILGGLVGITANANMVTNFDSIIIGGIAGLVVVGGVRLLDLLKIDDPVGAFPVHGLAGVWGGLATGIFGVALDDNGAITGSWPFVPQLIGSIVVPLWAFVTMFILFYIMKMVNFLRVPRDEELKGLDITEHGEEAYKGFAIFTLD